MYVEEGAQDHSFVEQVLNCQVGNMSHHGGGEGCGCGERSLWCAGMGVGGEGKKGGRTVGGMLHLSQPLHSVASVDADKYRIAVAG